MGRKPNQLVIEFFDRGAKLEDASNRYRYTCKACGEHFPKGRMDSLVTHMTKMCTAVSPEDRQRALLRLQQTPEKPIYGPQSTQVNYDLLQLGSSGKFSSAEVKKLSGLEALAEASRQVEYPNKNGQSRIQVENLIDPSLEEPTIYEGYTKTHERARNSLGVSQPDPFPALQSPDVPPTSTFIDGNFPSISTAIDSSYDLSRIAASASDLEALLPLTDLSTDHGAASNGKPFDTYYQVQTLKPRSTWPMRQDSSNQGSSAHSIASPARASTYPKALAIQASRSPRSSENEERPLRNQRIRGKFTESRRKEVREVRKRGACIRCRMLRKTCSDGDPCSTCASVESARLWKLPCMRTRIASEFELYSTELYAKIAEHETVAVRQQYEFKDDGDQILLSHSNESNIHVECKALTASIEPVWDTPYDKEAASGNDTQLWLLDDISDRTTESFNCYAKTFTVLLLDQERSRLMRATLSIALKLSVEKNDHLLAEAVDLWTLTGLLLDYDPQWQMQVDNTVKRIPEGLSSPLQRRKLPSLHKYQFPTQYNLIRSQTQALTEKKAFKLSKSILNELEKRLLQRPQCQGFETFLVALILLSCVERMCWLFQTWDNHETSMMWPLASLPSQYVQQGSTFSDLVCMLLRMRGVMLKSQPDPQTGYLISTDKSDEAARQWFKEVELTASFLEERANAAFDALNPRCWELKYGAKLLIMQ